MKKRATRGAESEDHRETGHEKDSLQKDTFMLTDALYYARLLKTLHFLGFYHFYSLGASKSHSASILQEYKQLHQ